MSNRFSTLHIGMKYSGKELIVEESKLGTEKFKEFIANLERAMDSKVDGFDLLDKDNNYLYVRFDSIAYISGTHEKNDD